MTAQHPDDDTLNEYLDDALDAPAHAQAAAHLAACPQCAARLEALRVLFATLEALPEEPPARDLSAGVLARLPRPVETPAVPPKLRWIIAAQALLALVFLTVTAPFILAMLPATEFATFSRAVTQFVTELVTGLAAQVQSLSDSLVTWPEQVLSGVRALTAPFAEAPTLLLGAGLSAALILWLLGNSALLRVIYLTGSRSWKN